MIAKCFRRLRVFDICVPIIFLLTFAISTVLSPSSLRAGVISENKDRSTPQLLFESEFQANPQFTDEQQAYSYLSANSGLFSLPPDLSNLKLTGVQESLIGKHFHFQQFINGIPVEYAEIIVSIGQGDGEVYMVFNNTYPQKRPISLRPVMGRANALDIAWNHLRVHGSLKSVPSARLFYMPEGEDFRLIYKTQTNVSAPRGDWEIRIDALTGEVISVRDTAISRKNVQRKLDFEKYEGAVFDRNETTEGFLMEQSQTEAALAAATTVNGTALVFDPDPRTTLMDDTIQDTDPAGTFTNAYVSRTLRDITKDGNVYSLVGPWIRIFDIEPPYTAPSTTTDGNWTATRGDNAFNDAMTYFHIDQNQRYIQSLGFTNIQNGTIDADSDAEQICFGGPSDGVSCIQDDCPGGSCIGGTCNAGTNIGQPCTIDDCPWGTCESDDQSHYHTSTNSLTFGHGCVDDNEDADVILHEYGHAIQHSINSNWIGGDTGAMGEGFCDYWAGSYSYSTPNGPNFHPEWVFHWDGHSNCWAGRVMDQLTFQYDPFSTYPEHTWVNGVYSDELWSTPLFQSFLELINQGRPRQEIDRIVLQSQFGLGSGLTMPVLANATVTAAQSLYPSGPHALVYAKHFGNHNILVTYVDGNWLGTETGTIDSPYNTIAEGVADVITGARLSLKAGNYTGTGNSPITISKPMTIGSYGGVATIGQME